MGSFLKNKLLYKKWMNFCLIVGVVFLIAVSISHPIYKEMVSRSMLKGFFYDYMEETGAYPATITYKGMYGADAADVDSITQNVAEKRAQFEEAACVPVKTDVLKLYYYGQGARNQYHDTSETGTTKIDIVYLEDIESHSNIIYGEMYDTAETAEGVYGCIMSRAALESQGFVLGELIYFNTVMDVKGHPLTMQITGVFEESSSYDEYWVTAPSGYRSAVFVSTETMADITEKYEFNTLFIEYNALMDFTAYDISDVEDAAAGLSTMLKDSDVLSSDMTDLLDKFTDESNRVNTILWVLEIPIIVLMAAFIIMHSGKIVEAEGNEIAMLKSRGASRKNIVGIYTLQSMVLGVISLIIAIPLGFLLSIITASTNSFMGFSLNSFEVRFNPEMAVYGLISLLVSVLCMVIPAIKYSKLDIVEKKANVKADRKPLWEKIFLDIILLSVSIYLIHNFTNQKGDIADRILEGAGIDPLLFLSAPLFMLAVGMVSVRLINLIIRLIFFVFKRFLKPALYASFLQLIRTGKKQSMISIFMVLTIAMGIYDSVAARTINQTATEREAYDVGTDMIIEEDWKIRTSVNQASGEVSFAGYEDPGYNRWEALSGQVESMTRVITDDDIKVQIDRNMIYGCSYMAINTKEFGETAELADGLLDTHWYNYLNELAKSPNGVLVSSNLGEDYDLEVGDEIIYERYYHAEGESGESGITLGMLAAKIVGFVDAWPGYSEYRTYVGEDGLEVTEANYLVIANYAKCYSTFSLTPYEIWIKTGESNQAVYDYMADEANNIRQCRVTDLAENIREITTSRTILVTNGMLTVGFIIVLILCVIGFLVYWIMSIRQRELLFGVYRAMGMSMREINAMLINEHIFSSLMSVITGIVTGVVTSYIFVPLITIAYSPEEHVVPFELVINMSDMLRMALIVGAAIILCIIILGGILRKMNIAQALKLGED